MRWVSEVLHVMRRVGGELRSGGGVEGAKVP